MSNHVPVLYTEALHALNIQANGVYLDCTFGRGGHSSGILQQLGNAGQLLALDRDLDAIKSPEAIKLSNDKRFKLHHSSFSALNSVLSQANLTQKLDGILLDLGVSSPQLDQAQRGFSFMRDGELDMRMDTSTGLSAAEWLAQVDEAILVQVLFDYGEERFARRIAKAIVTARLTTKFASTVQLAALIADAVPYIDKHKHPATRSFQAIRIAVNAELDELQKVLVQAVDNLASGGKLVVISFHSLEDRIVKRFMRSESGHKYNPGRLPIKEVDIEQGGLKLVSKAIKANKTEVSQNSRARSAVMRVAEKI